MFWKVNFCDIAISVSYVSSFLNSVTYVASFARVHIPFDRTRVFLVPIFLKVRCSENRTRVIV
ncbi:MAG: hypothetical protein AYK19_17355 [Theionarchaea archaeon DG-70-1]|nr:MAG: hypothetical protein AYK19_17355 [Theionarchaea archaeon DG-70-1]